MMESRLPYLPAAFSSLSALGLFRYNSSQKSLSLIWISSGVIRTIGPAEDSLFTVVAETNSHTDSDTIFLVHFSNIE